MGSLLNNRFTRPLFNPAMRLAIRFGPTRRMINALHNRMEFALNERFFWSFGSAFRGVPANRAPRADWHVNFGAAKVVVPLGGGPAWQRWAIAIGLRGHDSSIKETYAAIVASPRRPCLFVDVGANDGTHSLLLASQGIRTVSFEPNPECRTMAELLFSHNKMHCDWRPIALGQEKREVILAFPPGDTSLGIVSTAGTDIGEVGIRSMLAVQQERLDDQELPAGATLLKIDVEGNEFAVLEGASAFLAARRPIVIFESNPGDLAREVLYAFLTERRYRIAEMPWWPGRRTFFLDESNFAASTEANFIALPPEVEAA